MLHPIEEALSWEEISAQWNAEQDILDAQYRGWNELGQYWRRLPEVVVLDVAEPIQQFRLRALTMHKLSEFIESVLKMLLTYARLPGQQWFFEMMEHVYDEYGALEGVLSYTQLSQAIEALGIDLIGRMTAWGVYNPRRKFLYRFQAMNGFDVVLKKLTLTELEDYYASTLPLSGPRMLHFGL